MTAYVAWSHNGLAKFYKTKRNGFGNILGVIFQSGLSNVLSFTPKLPSTNVDFSKDLDEISAQLPTKKICLFFSYPSTSMIGGLQSTQPINDEVKQICQDAKPQIEAKAGKTFSTFEPKEFSTQIVAGTNYFVKIDVGNEFIHARIFRDLDQNLSLHSLKTGLGQGEPIGYF